MRRRRSDYKREEKRNEQALDFDRVRYFLATACPAEVFKSPTECVVGRRVADKHNKTGKIVRAPKNDSLCMVLMDDTHKEHTFIFWMLHAEGASAETSDKLVPGTYQCFAGLPLVYTDMDVIITGPNTYSTAGSRGTFHVEPSMKIVFESGPLVKATAKLLQGPRIGMNTNGGTFYGTTCGLKKN